jgi:DNA-binding transcriptional ArsR family regulator
MDIEERVAALEAQLAELTARFGDSGSPSGTPAETSRTDVYWALDGLRTRVAGVQGGAVLFTGTVDLPTGEHYEWQHGLPVETLMEDDWAAWAGTLGALGHPARLLLLRRVLAGVRTTADLATDEGLGTTGQIYHHLRQLVSAGWLRSSARGQYAVPGERVVPLLVILSGARR